MYVSWENSSAYVIQTKVGLKQFTDFLTVIDWQSVKYIQDRYL